MVLYWFQFINIFLNERAVYKKILFIFVDPEELLNDSEWAICSRKGALRLSADKQTNDEFILKVLPLLLWSDFSFKQLVFSISIFSTNFSFMRSFREIWTTLHVLFIYDIIDSWNSLQHRAILQNKFFVGEVWLGKRNTANVKSLSFYELFKLKLAFPRNYNISPLWMVFCKLLESSQLYFRAFRSLSLGSVRSSGSWRDSRSKTLLCSFRSL